MNKKRMSYHYKKVLYITVMYSDGRSKPCQWLIMIDSDFPPAAQKFVDVKKVEVRKRRIYDT